MENIISQIPTTPIGWFAAFVVILGGAIYLMSQTRRNDLETLRASNKDLRDSQADMRAELDEMKLKLAELETKNGTLYEIVSSALDKYFRENPESVKNYQAMLQSLYEHNKDLIYAKTKR